MSKALLSMAGVTIAVGFIVALALLSAASIAGKPRRRSTRTRKGIRHGR